ncbi:MAG: glycoprotease [Candidatus Magnetoglobus multicellularis str. Araruama]|uniref:Glycoprotease n=1 Tax=Candidatus Magnetoglobus multicellularis str. Araruama TaxID=890399 RepID=A0A1V1P9B1_9BACT|nr:MAG: glycoprotease [Candidatus Magnetoglobus multicellularis str. Araruama]
MIIMAIDMSGDRCSIGISQNQTMLAESSTYARMRHLPKVMPQIDYTLKQADKKIQDVDLFCAVSGPGSWTGIRIAITMLKTFSHTLSKPCVTVDSLSALACNIRFVSPMVYTILDAARKQVYCAGFDCQTSIPKRVESSALKKMDLFLQELSKPAILVGDAIKAYPEITQQLQNQSITIAPESVNRILISHVIEMGFHKYQETGSEDVHSLSPVYLQKTDAERNFVEKKES